MQSLAFSTLTPRLFTALSLRRVRVTPQRPRFYITKMTADYTLYYTPTPNGKKISLALEELGLSYDLERIDISKGDQFKPEFLAISPNNKIPALIDHKAEGGDLAVFESGAILEYLADKTGRLIPPMLEIRKRMMVKQWLYWQMAGFGPMLGQLGFFYKFAKEDVPVAKERYLKEAIRLFGVLDRRLGDNRYVGGEDYSIADIACYWWSLGVFNMEQLREHFEEFENVKRWLEEIGGREAVARVNAISF